MTSPRKTLTFLVPQCQKWLADNTDKPHPTSDEKEVLVAATGMTRVSLFSFSCITHECTRQKGPHNCQEQGNRYSFGHGVTPILSERSQVLVQESPSPRYAPSSRSSTTHDCLLGSRLWSSNESNKAEEIKKLESKLMGERQKLVHVIARLPRRLVLITLSSLSLGKKHF